MPESPLTPDLIASFEADMDQRRPEPMAEADLMAAQEVVAITPATLNAGFAVRCATRSGGTIDLVMNPVVARHIAACILMMGQQARWLDQAGNVVIRPTLDS